MNNRRVETGPPQENKRAIFCFPCAVGAWWWCGGGGVIHKRNKEGILLRPLFPNSLPPPDFGGGGSESGCGNSNVLKCISAVKLAVFLGTGANSVQ